jgi:uncharacterized membrane protein YdbT with pleckstrin-like domain
MGYPAGPLPEERVMLTVRHHFVVLWKPVAAELGYIVLWMAAMSVTGFHNEVLNLAGLILFVPFFVWSAVSVLRYSRASLSVTDRRLSYTSGVLTRKTRDVALSSITDVSAFQSVLDRTIGAGDVVVKTSGDDGELAFLRMPQPERLKQQILALVHELHATAADSDNRAMAEEVAHAINRTQPTSEMGVLPAERPPLYSEIVDQIERLDQMRERGVLSDEEFQRAKEALLERLYTERKG